MSLTQRILISMVAGLCVGILFNVADTALSNTANHWIDEFIIHGVFDTVGRIFVASLKLLVVPLVFVSLVCGASQLGGNARMGAMAAKTIVLYMLTTGLAIGLALLIANLVQPGQGIGLNSASEYIAKDAPPLKEVLINIFPSNPLRAMVEGNMLQVIVFSLLMGIAIAHSGEAGQRMSAWFEDMNGVIMKMVNILMELAPYGIFVC